MERTAELVERLEAIAAELGDLAYERLQAAAGAASRGETVDPDVLHDEKRLARARRAVEKAASVLRSPGTIDA